MQSPQVVAKSSSEAKKKCAKKKSKDGYQEEVYEKLSLALLAKKGYEQSKDNSGFRDFSVGREVGIGREGKFDDVVFRYEDQGNRNNLIFVQIKHKQDDYQIDSDILSTEASKAEGGGNGNMKRDFNLQKYFISYLNVREELKNTKSRELRNGVMKYVVIFTNVGLNIDELEGEGFMLKKAPYDIIHLFTLKKTSLIALESAKNCLQLCKISDGLRDILKKSSDLRRLATEFAKYVVWEKHRINNVMGIDVAPLKYYHVAVAREILEISDEVKKVSAEKEKVKNEKYCVAKFQDSFVRNLTGSKQKLREALFEAIKELDNSKRAMSDAELKNILKKTEWKVTPKFGKTKAQNEIHLPRKWKAIKDEDVEEFLECLVFIVNQPRVNELMIYFSISDEHAVLNDISLSHVLDKIENTGPEFKKHIEKVLGIEESTKYKEKWICGDQIVNFFEQRKKLISVKFIVTAMTLIYESEVMQYGEFKQYGKLEKILHSFLESESKILCVNTSITLFSSIKVIQYLNKEKNYKVEEGRISVCLDSLKCKENRDYIIKSFELDSNNLLIIECRHAENERDMEDLYCKLSAIFNLKDNKKIILIIQQDIHSYLSEKFKDYFHGKGLFIHEEVSINVIDFEPEKNPFTKSAFVFQEQEEKISLMDLTGINSWDSYKHYISEGEFQCNRGIIDLMVKVLNSEEIEIGSKPLGTSSLEGAYAHLFEEINTKTLAGKLLSQEPNNNTKYMYVISGINGFNDEEKINRLNKYLGLGSEPEVIGNQFRDIDGDGKMQIADDLFNEQTFRRLCHNYPERQIFWICTKYTERGFKFFLQMFYNPKFYLKRKFRQVIIKTDVKDELTRQNLSDTFIFHSIKGQQEISDLFKLNDEDENEKFENNRRNCKIKLFSSASEAEAAFQEHCGQNQTVHWLKVEEEQIIWCNSHGSVASLRSYKDKEQSEVCLVEEDNLVKEIKDKKVVIIADDPGMGKTTTLRKLCESKDEYLPFVETHWVITINLRDHLQAIRDIEVQNGKLNVLDVINFLSKVDSKLNHNLAKSLLELAILDKSKHFSNSKPLLLAFDGFDEVLDEEDRKKIILMLRFLKNETAVKLWITTRLHCEETLENELLTFAIEFVPMNEDDKLAYINKYLRDRLYLILSEEKFAALFFDNDEMHRNKIIVKYTEEFLKKMTSVFKDDTFKFIGTPLQLYLMLEDSIKHFIYWMKNDTDDSPNFDYLGNDICEVYEKFIDRKYEIYFRKVDFKELVRERHEKFILEEYSKSLAKSKLFYAKPKKSLQEFKAIVLSVGIIISQGNNVEFIHSTFIEFFAAKVFIDWIKKEPNVLSNSKKRVFLLREILLKPVYKVTRAFLNVELGKITDSEMAGGSLKQYGKIAVKLLQEKQRPLFYKGETLLHVAVTENNANIVRLLLGCLKDHKSILENFLFAVTETDDDLQPANIRSDFKRSNTDFLEFLNYGKTALHLACKSDNVEIVRILLDAAERISEEKLQRLLYTLNYNKTNVLDEAVKYSKNVEILKEFLMRARDKLKLVADENKTHNSFCLACKYGKEEFVKTFLQEFEHDEQSLKQVLLCNHECGNPLYRSVKSSTIVKSLLEAAKSINDNNETLKSLLLEYGPLLRENIDVVKMLINVTNNLNDDNCILKQLLLPESPFSPLWYATNSGNIDLVKILLNAAKEINDDNHTLKQLLLSEKHDLPLTTAIVKNNIDVIEMLLNVAEEMDDDNQTLKQLLLPARGELPLNSAIILENIEVVELFLNVAKGLNDDNDILKQLLLPEEAPLPLNYAIASNETSGNIVVKILLKTAKDIKDDNHTLKQLLLPENDVVLLNTAIVCNNIYLIEILVNVAKTFDDDNHTLKQLLFNEIAQDSALFYAARKGHCDIIKILLKIAASVDIGFLENFVCAVDKNGENAIDLMIKYGHEEMFTDFLKFFEEAEYRTIQDKVKEMHENVPLRAKLHLEKKELLTSIYTNDKSGFKRILNNAKNSSEKLKILLLTDARPYVIFRPCTGKFLAQWETEKIVYANTLQFACEEGQPFFIKELLSYAIDINDGGTTLKELITDSNSENKTSFEVLEDGYTNEIKQIIEDLIREAEKNNNLQVVNILHELNQKYTEVIIST